FEMTNGLFAPGATTEPDGSSEIEFNVDNPGNNDIEVFGRPGDDEITIGGRLTPFVNDLNLDGIEDGDHPDADVTVHGAPWEVVLDGRQGKDTLSGQGTGASGSCPAAARLSIAGGDGEDVLRGGNCDDTLTGLDGLTPAADVISGGPGFDTAFYLGASDDLHLSLDGVANDGANCPGPQCEG